MKKLYNGKGRRVHPTPPPPTASPPLWGHLAALPAAVLALAAALTAEEQEVLAYLLSGSDCTGTDGGKGARRKQQKQRRSPHEPELGCDCFGCYKSFWARWDASPNRHVIHLIIDAFEETLESQERSLVMGRADRGRSGGRRRAGRRRGQGADEESPDKEAAAAAGKGFLMMGGGHIADDDGGYDVDEEDDDEDGGESVGSGSGSGEGCGKSSVRRLVSFIGERVWGVWK